MAGREAAEALESGAETVNNIVHSFRLTSTSFDKKSYLTYLKGYMKAIKAKLQESDPDRVPIFEKNVRWLMATILHLLKSCCYLNVQAAAFAKKVVGSFGDYEFYTGESMQPEGMIALLNYRVS